MRRNSPLPPLVLGLFTVLVAGAVVLGLFEAPTTPDLTVQNGIGEVVNASSFTYLVYNSADPAETERVTYQGPDRVTEALYRGAPVGRPVRTASAKGPDAVATAVKPFKDVQDIDGFSPRGSGFVATRPISSLVPADEASEVSGAFHYTATVRGGYLVNLVVRYRYSTPGGTESGTDRLLVTHVAGQRVPAT